MLRSTQDTAQLAQLAPLTLQAAPSLEEVRSCVSLTNTLGSLAIKAKKVGQMGFSLAKMGYNFYSDYFPRLQIYLATPLPAFTPLEQKFCKPSNFQSLTDYLDLPLQTFSHCYTSARSMLDDVHQHPYMQKVREFFVLKQTCDFSITLAKWLSGEKSSTSMLYQTANTALAWSPVIFEKLSELDDDTLMTIASVASGLALLYSFSKDYASYRDPQKREQSPVSNYITHTFSRVSNAVYSFFGS